MKKGAERKLLSAEQLNIDELQSVLDSVTYKKHFRKIVRSTLYTLVIVAAISVLIATLWMPVLQVFGSSMTPTLHEGEVVIAMKAKEYKTNDIIAFYYNNKVLVKRVIAGPGDWVDIEEDGTVYVNNQVADESFVEGKSKGDCDIELPYQVADSRYFVMGDHRAVSLDSRNAAIGCVAEEQIVGELHFRIWPLNRIGIVD